VGAVKNPFPFGSLRANFAGPAAHIVIELDGAARRRRGPSSWPDSHLSDWTKRISSDPVLEPPRDWAARRCRWGDLEWNLPPPPWPSPL